MLGHIRRALAIAGEIGRRQRTETVHIAIEHAESGGDEHRIVNLVVGGALGSGPRDIVLTHVAPAALHARGNRQQGLHLRRDGC